MKAQIDQPKAFRLPTQADNTLANQDLELPVEEIARKHSRTYVAHTKDSLSGVPQIQSSDDNLKIKPNDSNKEDTIETQSGILSNEQSVSFNGKGSIPLPNATKSNALTPLHDRKVDSK